MIEIKVVGPGCSNCVHLEAICQEVVTESSLEATIVKVTDQDQYLDLGVMMTPGLLINNKLVSMGKIPSKESIAKWIDQAI